MDALQVKKTTEESERHSKPPVGAIQAAQVEESKSKTSSHQDNDADTGSYTQETVQTDDELIADNVQTFINMHLL